jgi:hypothetical protein
LEVNRDGGNGMAVRIPHPSLQNCRACMIVKLFLNRLSMNQERTEKHTYYKNAANDTCSKVSGLVDGHAETDHKTKRTGKVKRSQSRSRGTF